MFILQPVPPIQVRANSVRKEMEQTKTLTSKLENKESDIKELRKLLKEKQEQLSEMTIRKELAEKKLGNVNKDYELTIEKLQRKLEEAHNNYKKKEKEFEETLDHLQTDIDSLENEKGEMKEKLKLLSKKAQLEVSLSKSISGRKTYKLLKSLYINIFSLNFRITAVIIAVFNRAYSTSSCEGLPIINARNREFTQVVPPRAQREDKTRK